MRHRYHTSPTLGVRHLRGWRPSSPDPRDFMYMAPEPVKASTLPDEIDLRDKLGPIEDQGSIGSCVAHACTAAMEFLYQHEGKPTVQLSRLGLYYLARQQEGVPASEDSGTTIRDAMRAASEVGVPPEDLWPYQPEKFAEAPPAGALTAAAQHKVLFYYRLPSAAFIDLCLGEGFPVIFGMRLGDTFTSDAAMKTGRIPPPTPGMATNGGHSMLIVGRRRSEGVYIVRNSWGTGVGDAGYFYLPTPWAADGWAADFTTVRRGML